MSIIREIRVSNGEEWAIGGHVYSNACVIVPIERTYGMSDEELGQEVRLLFSHAECAFLDEIVGHSIHDINLRKLNYPNAKSFLETYESYYDALSKYDTKEFGELCELIDKCREVVAKRESKGLRQPKDPKEYQAVQGVVYVIKSPTGEYKIGKSKDHTQRLSWFRIKLPFQVETVLTIKTEDMSSLERQLHLHFKDKRINGEWFSLNETDLDYLFGIKESFELQTQREIPSNAYG